MNKILSLLANETKGRSYKSHKYNLEEIEKPTFVYDDKRSITFPKGKVGETDKSDKPKNLKEKAEYLSKNSKPLFRYFLDGSRKTYKTDDFAYGQRIYPVIAGQIGVACCERPNPHTFKGEILERHLVIVLPDCMEYKNKELYLNNKIQKINEIEILKKRDIQFQKILLYQDIALKEGEKYEHKAIAKIHEEMINLEKKMVGILAKQRKLNVETYLLKDGSLEYSEKGSEQDYRLSLIKSNYKCVVGVSKAFNPELFKDNKGNSIATLIADLKKYERTPAYKYVTEYVEDVEFCVWYLRIRDKDKTISPYDGILKVEKILSDEERDRGLDSDEIDRISANIINESFPTCFGSDRRWANHLYPVYLTETYIKSNFLSEQFFLNLF
jgi:hypothetical protein